jgi:hypothetical protein
LWGRASLLDYMQHKTYSRCTWYMVPSHIASSILLDDWFIWSVLEMYWANLIIPYLISFNCHLSALLRVGINWIHQQSRNTLTGNRIGWLDLKWWYLGSGTLWHTVHACRTWIAHCTYTQGMDCTSVESPNCFFSQFILTLLIFFELSSHHLHTPQRIYYGYTSSLAAMMERIRYPHRQCDGSHVRISMPRNTLSSTDSL